MWSGSGGLMGTTSYASLAMASVRVGGSCTRIARGGLTSDCVRVAMATDVRGWVVAAVQVRVDCGIELVCGSGGMGSVVGTIWIVGMLILASKLVGDLLDCGRHVY